MPPTPTPTHETNRLAALLTLKLAALPPHHLPTLTLHDITLPSPTATHIPHIPPDIQLAFFLRHRAQFARHADRAIKSEDAQSMAATRAVWYYRLDAEQQFQRYHDGVRWNLGIMVALIAAAEKAKKEKEKEEDEEEEGMPRWGVGRRSETSTFDDPTPIPPGAITQRTYPVLSPSATRFVTAYLAAVLEQHTAPTLFLARDTFVRLWKASRWSLFRVRSASHKKLLKGAMKRLAREWSVVMDAERQRLGEEAFERGGGRFVGSLIPGRRSSGVVLRAGRGSGGKMGKGGCDGDGNGDGDEGDKGDNVLLDALRVPFESSVGCAEKGEGLGYGQEDTETSTVAGLSVAIAVMQRMRAKDILPVLMRLFPPQH